MKKKIFIIGNAGSGKTTLAAKLSGFLGISHYDLDVLRAPQGHLDKLSDARMTKIAQEIAGKSTWIAEGIYYDWTEVLMQKADQIIWLDIPPYRLTYRIFKRFIRNKFTGTHRWGGILNTLRLITTAHQYHFFKRLKRGSATRALTAEALHTHSRKVVHIKNSRELRLLLKTFS